MVFDEVDAGVGGAAALALGDALHEVARRRQVLVVTHLAQVASQADAHICVVKRASKGRTVTSATTVEGEERVTELLAHALGAPGQRRRPRARPRAARHNGPGVVHHGSRSRRLSWSGAPIIWRAVRRPAVGVTPA